MPATTTPTRLRERPTRRDLIGLRLLPEESERVRRLAEAWDCTPTEVVRRALLRELHRA